MMVWTPPEADRCAGVPPVPVKTVDQQALLPLVGFSSAIFDSFLMHQASYLSRSSANNADTRLRLVRGMALFIRE
jgi:hypothetical protein